MKSKSRFLKALLAAAVLQTLTITPAAAHGVDFRVTAKMEQLAANKLADAAAAPNGDPRDLTPFKPSQQTQQQRIAFAATEVLSAMAAVQADFAAEAVHEDHALAKALGRSNKATKAYGEMGAVRLLHADIEHTKITVNLSREILEQGLGSQRFEQTLRNIHSVISQQIYTELPEMEFATQIEGVPLINYLRDAGMVNPPPTKSFRAELLAHASVSPSVPIRGSRVAISPGHGWTFANGGWGLQRSYQFGIVEDFANHEFVRELNDKLLNVGAIVRPTRNLDLNAGNGESGRPKWQEAARYHVKALGVPAAVWDSSTVDENDDIRCRPLYANWQDANGFAANVLVSVHNNGAKEPNTATGTETLYDTTNGYGGESKKFADFIHNKVIAAIRKDYKSDWVDRKVKGFDGSYGENRLAKMPAVIVEVAFMDNENPDSAAIKSATFRAIVAEAITQGVAEYLASTVFVDSTAPTVPSSIQAQPFGATQINLAWAASLDDTGVSAYRVSRNGAVIATTAVPSHVDTNLTPETTYNYSIVAVDAAGNASAASTTLSAKTLSATPQFQPIGRGTSQTNCWSMLDPKSPRNVKKCT